MRVVRPVVSGSCGAHKTLVAIVSGDQEVRTGTAACSNAIVKKQDTHPGLGTALLSNRNMGDTATQIIGVACAKLSYSSISNGDELYLELYCG